MASPIVPILLVLVGGAVVLGGAAKGGSKAKRTTPGKVAASPVPAWCKQPLDPERLQQLADETKRQIAAFPPWEGDTGEALRVTYEVTKLVLGSLCGGIDLPAERYHLATYYETKPEWWRKLWDAVSIWAWQIYVEPSD